MAEKSKELLKTIWMHFLEVGQESREEKEYLLDLFLDQFIYLEATEGKPRFSVFIDWSSVGNQLVHHFMSDIHEICSQQIQTVETVTQSMENIADDNRGIIELLHHYALQQRGWKLLYALNSIGLQDVTCTKELVNLFTSLFPLCLQLPVDPSLDSGLLKTNKEIRTLEECLSLKKRPRHLILHSSHKPNATRRLKQRHHKSNLKLACKKSDTFNKDDTLSNSDGEEQINSQCVVKKLKYVMQNKADNYVGSSETSMFNGAEISSVQKGNITPPQSVSLMTFCTCIIEILLEISLTEQQNPHKRSLVSTELIISFTLESLASFQAERFNIKHWPLDDVLVMKRTLLRIIAATLPNEVKTKHTVCNIKMFSSLLSIINTAISDLECEGKYNGSAEVKNISFYSELVMISLFWILQTTELSATNETATHIVQTVRTFSSNGGLLLCCKLISYIESNHWPIESKVKIVSGIVNVIRDVVISLKQFRLVFSLPVWYKNGQLQRRDSDVPDHHSNILGLPCSHSVRNKNPLCCVATMSCLLLDIHHIVNLDSFQVIVIGALRKCGLCCCLNFNEIVYNLLQKTLKCSRNLQVATLILLEKTIIKQFGLTSYNQNACCEICTRRDLYADHMKVDKYSEKDNLRSNCDNISKEPCNAFKLYYDYLISDGTLSDIAGNSLLNLILIGHETLRVQLFVQVVLPSFLLLSQLSFNSSIKDKLVPLEFCMISLPSLLQSPAVSDIFLKSEGLLYLCKLFELPLLQNIALDTLKVLILSQSENPLTSVDQPLCNHSVEDAIIFLENLLIQVTLTLCIESPRALMETDNASKSMYLNSATYDEKEDEYSWKSIPSETNVMYQMAKLQICLEEKTSTAFICNLWSTCSELVCKHAIFRKHMSSNSKVKFVYQFFETVFNKLYNFTKTSEIWKKANKVLLQSVLTVYIDLSSSEDVEMVISKNDVYQTLGEYLKKSHPEKIQDLSALFEILFECMTHVCGRQNNVKRRNCEMFPHFEEEESVFLSDASEGVDAEDEGYDADIEIDFLQNSMTTLQNKREEKLQRCNQYMCSIILDFLLFCNDRCSQGNSNWLSTLSHVTKQFGYLCHQEFKNRVIMHEQGLLKKMLITFKTILTSSLREYKEIQRNIMDLLVLVGRYSVTKEELELYIDLFKTPSAPMGTLLKGFHQLLKTLPFMPSSYFSFPMFQEPYPACSEATACVEDDKSDYHPLQNRHLLYKNDSNMDIKFCCWKLSAIFLPLREDGLWHPLQNGFSVSTWIAFGHPFDSSGSMQTNRQWKFVKGSCEASSDGPKELITTDDVYHILSVGTELMFEMWIEFSCGELIFRLTQSDDNGRYNCIQEASFSNLIEPHRWLHIGINYKERVKKDTVLGEVIVIVDGYKETKFFLNYSHLSDKCLYSCALLGHLSMDMQNSNNIIYYLGNTMLFQDNVLTKERCYYLSQLGPDNRSLTECCLESRPVFFCHNLTPNILECGIDIDILTCLRTPSLKPLQEKLLAIYSPNDPARLIVYPNVFSTVISLLTPLSSFQQTFKVVTNDQRSSQQQPVNKRITLKSHNIISASGLQHTIQSVGGIRLLLFLFGRVVECSEDEESHAVALNLILCLLQKDAKCYTTFQEVHGIKLLSRVLKDEKCITSYYMLQVLLNACLSGDILQVNSLQLVTVDTNSHAVIANPHIFKAVLSLWKIWEKLDSGVLKVLFLILQSLIRDRHPYQSYNLSQMLSIHMMDIIINILEETFEYMDKSLLSLEIATIIPQLIRKLLGTPANLELLKSIFDCMLLLHQASRTYVCHAYSSFYFLFPKLVAGKRTNQGESSSELSDYVRCDSDIDSNETESIKYFKGQRNDDMLQKKVEKHEKDMAFSNDEKQDSPFPTTIEKVTMNVENFSELSEKLPSNSVEKWQDISKENQDRVYSKTHKTDICISLKSELLGQNDNKVLHNEKKLLKIYDTEENPSNCVNPKKQVEDLSEDKLFLISNEVFTEEQASLFAGGISPKGVSYNIEKWENISLQSDVVNEEKSATTILFTGLITILRETILTCPDSLVKDTVSIVKPEVLIIFAHHPSSSVTCSAIMALDAYLQRCSGDDANNFLKIKGFHMLANQLHQFPATSEVLNACLTIIAGHPSKLEEQEMNFGPPLELNPVQMMACIPLLALIPNTSHDIVLCHNALSRLQQLLSQVPTALKILLENGLMESLAKLLSEVTHSKPNPIDIDGENEEDLIYEDVYRIIYATSSELISGSGSSNFHLLMNVLHLFSGLESSYSNVCDTCCSCIAMYRNCQCAIFTAAFDYIIMCSSGTIQEGHSTNKSKNVSSDSIHSDSILDILVNLPEMMNPYPFHLTSITFRSTMEDASLIDLLGSSGNVVGNKNKLCESLTFIEIVDRFRQILIKSVDFLVYKDANCQWSYYQQKFARHLFRITLKGMETSLERMKGTKKTLWSALMSSSLKETVHVQFGRLLITLLSPEQPTDQKLFIIRVLLFQDNCVFLLNHMFQTSLNNASRIAVLVHDLLYNCTHNINEDDKEEVLKFSELLTQCKIKIPKEFAAGQLIEETKKSMEEETKEGRKKWQLVKESIEKSILSQYDALVNDVSENAMKTTRMVVDAQNFERRKFMMQIKASLNERLEAQKEWCHLVEQLTHERAIWYLKDYYPQSWELDPTEGPLRVRRRLRRCYLKIEPRFLLPEYRAKHNVCHESPPLSYLYETKSQTDETAALIDKLHNNDKISYNCCCQIITSSVETSGEILIGERCIHFVAEECSAKGNEANPKCQTWLLEDIREVLQRRYELQDNALEIFLSNGLTHLVSFHSNSQREEFCTYLMQCSQLCLIAKKTLSSLTAQWRERSITNFEYLTHLNKIAGRSFNDLMQYPVFPFILSDYSSQILNLCDANIYRNFAKPIAIQNKARERHYIDSYNCLKAEFDSYPNTEHSLPITGPYHYGSHYSNSGTVLHFLVRLLPFTKMFLSYQDNNFDIPDRTFHSLNTSWRLSSGDSTSDVKELIPEFFFLPEFLLNSEGFNFGTRQTGERVHNVALPPWCQNDPRLFILINRQALESDVVTSELQNWIDLVFGFKQTGKAAVEAINVFHPATYYGHDISKIEERLSREALEATIRTVGQTPRQLFFSPHPMVELSVSLGTEQQECVQNVISSVKGIKWGSFVGSPASPEPVLAWRRTYSVPICKLLPLLTNDVFGLAGRTSLLLSHSKDKARGVASATYVMSTALISWGHQDGILRMKLQRDRPAIPLLQERNDKVTVCSSIPDCQLLFVGYKSGIVDVYALKFDSVKLEVHQTSVCTHLYGHSNEINAIFICKTYTIVVTASKDCSCIIWDLNRLHYVRSITDHTQAVEIVSVSDTLGDIVSVSHLDSGSCLKVHTVNGQIVGTVHCPIRITAVCYSTVQEGTAVNVIAAGLINGTIKLWNSWNLNIVSEIKTSQFCCPITSLTYSCDNHHLYAADNKGTVAMWENPSKGIKKTRFLTLV